MRRICVFCGGHIDAGAGYFCAGVDLAGWPDQAPVTMFACEHCKRAGLRLVADPAPVVPVAAVDDPGPAGQLALFGPGGA